MDGRAVRLLQRLYGPLEDPSHFLRPTDDRYLSHYMGHSVIRAALHLKTQKELAASEPEPSVTTPDPSIYPEAGYVIWPHAMLSLRKGGVLTVKWPSGRMASDFGWTFATKGKRYVTHWWSDRWTATERAGGWEISGDMVPCRELISSPGKHMALRVASRLLGRVLIGALKKVMIFKSHLSPYRFQRTVRVESNRCLIEDRIIGLPPDVEPEPAPRASKRHVASADSWHPEDVEPVPADWRMDRQVERDANTWFAKTVWTYGE